MRGINLTIKEYRARVRPFPWEGSAVNALARITRLLAMQGKQQLRATPVVVDTALFFTAEPLSWLSQCPQPQNSNAAMHPSRPSAVVENLHFDRRVLKYLAHKFRCVS